MEPSRHIGAENVVLHYRGKSCRTVLVCSQSRQSVAQVEQPSGFRLVHVTMGVDPALDCPAVELPATHVDAAVELPGQEVRDRGLAGCLSANDQPDALRCHRLSQAQPNRR